jgi:hypothetical protein
MLDATVSQKRKNPRAPWPGTEQCQQQRNAEVHHQAQVEAQAVGESFEEGRGRGIEDHLAVVDQQRQAQQENITIMTRAHSSV